MQAADAVHVASSARRAAPKLQAPMRTPRGPIPRRGRTVDRYAPGGPGAERLAGIERPPVRAAAKGWGERNRCAARSVAGGDGRTGCGSGRGSGSGLGPRSGCSGHMFPSPRGTARRSVSPVGTGRGGGTSRGAAPAAMFAAQRRQVGVFQFAAASLDRFF